jgi:DNA mismatch endonuclease (patch repair protein)
MSNVKPKDSLIELQLRRALWSRGHRYRLHVRTLPGTPDIVFRRFKVAVFVDSEFWHGFDWQSRRDRIGTNRDYWIPKIEATMARDVIVTGQLEAAGWTVLRFWGKRIHKDLYGCVGEIEHALGYIPPAPFQDC